ncbi:MAG: hypothetical protein ABIS03_04235, partial [Gemmatimonadaceae bacterium]
MEIGDTFDTAPVPAKATRRSASGSSAAARRTGSNGKGGGKHDAALAEILVALQDLRDGDFSVRLAEGRTTAVIDQIAEAFNGVAERSERLAAEAVRVSTTIGREGQIDERASIGRATGGWTTITSSINSVITDLVSPTSEVARVLTAVAAGDLSQKMVLEIDGKSVQG